MPSNWREPTRILVSLTQEFGLRVLYMPIGMTYKVPRTPGESRAVYTEDQAKEIAAQIQGFLGEVEPK